MASEKKKPKEKLTVERATADFKLAYRAKRKLIEREKNDFLFALGDQWSKDDLNQLASLKITPVTDNRIAPNIFLLTGLERQNRTDFKAFPQGDEDSLKAEIASALLKDSIRRSDFSYKSSDQFKDGITCGESHLELYLDFTDSLINGKPCWRKCDGDAIFPDPASREYDFSDARFVYKIKSAVSLDDLVNLYPEKEDLLRKAAGSNTGGGHFGISSMVGEGAQEHIQYKDYPTQGQGQSDPLADDEDKTFDLVERYYKKWIPTYFVGDKQTGEVKASVDRPTAENFISEYKNGIAQNAAAYDAAVQQILSQHLASMPPEAQALPVEQHLEMLNQNQQLPPPPPEQDPDRFIIVRRVVPEIWCFAFLPGMEEPLADARAWFYPKWKQYPFVPYFARFSTAPLSGDDRHLLVQGVVYGVKGAQEKHNKAELLMLRHLNTATNSGWLAEEDSWVNPAQVQALGSSPGVNLEYKSGKQRPERITPTPLSQGHAQLALDSAESIKAQLGINSDLLAAQQGGADSGRAIALRQKQGLLMVQELYDNLSRSREIAGRFLLSQLGEIYDTQTAMKVLGEAFLTKNFPPVQLLNPQTAQMENMMDPATGQPMQYDKEMAELAVAEVLSGELGEYDVTVGESVASETQKMAVSAEIREVAQAYPGIIPADVLVRHSQLPESAKTEILSAIQQAQAAASAVQSTPTLEA